MQPNARTPRKNGRTILRLPIHLIERNPFQPRIAFNDEADEALAISIAT